METSNDDDGDSAGAMLTKASLIFFAILPAACYKTPIPEKTLKPITITVRAPEQKIAVSVPAKKKKKKLYLTFDDGPNKGTKNVLRIVEDEQIPVSFFIVGEHVFASPAQTSMWDSLRMAEQIELCNHSYSHAGGRYEKFYRSPDSVVKDFKRSQDSLLLDNAIARTPGRNIWRIDTLQFTDLKKSAAAADSLQNAGFILMGWDLEWHFDSKTMSVSTSAENLVAQIDSIFKYNKTRKQDHLVLLAHDQVYQKSEDSLALRQFIQLLKLKDEYELSLVSNYPGAMKNLSDSLKLKSAQ